MSDPVSPTPRLPLHGPGPIGRAEALELLRQAAHLAEQGEYDLASVGYSRLVGHQDPEIHVAALLGFADARYRMDDDEGALQAWVVATQAPETSNSWRAWKAIAATRVRAGDLPGAARAYRETERRAPPEERPEIASRLGWLNKEMGQEWRARRDFGRSRTGLQAVPAMTLSILAVTIAIGLTGILGIGDIWYQLFQLDKPAVAQGELYRLVTVTLVHAPGTLGVIHLGFNMYALYLLGPIIESLYGRTGLLLAYVLCAAAGSTASFLFSAAPFGVGASGAIFGLVGMLLIANRVHKPMLGRQARAITSQLGMLVVINLVIGFSAGGIIDNSAHIGGLIAGGWLGLMSRPRGATLASMWQRPSRDPVPLPAPEAASRQRSGAIVVQAIGIVLLLAVLAVGLVTGGVGR